MISKNTIKINPSSRKKVIACAALIAELTPVLPPDVALQSLDFGLHVSPRDLHAALQRAIDETGDAADVIILGYGLCSKAVIGLKSAAATLVIPRVDDCIGVFLGSNEAYRRQCEINPGTFFLSKGWIEAGETPFSECATLAEQMGAEKAEAITRSILKYYSRLVLIDTGLYPVAPYRLYAQQAAQRFNLKYEELPGSPNIVHKMVSGPWDDDFIVVHPGEAACYDDFLS